MASRRTHRRFRSSATLIAYCWSDCNTHTHTRRHARTHTQTHTYTHKSMSYRCRCHSMHKYLISYTRACHTHTARIRHTHAHTHTHTHTRTHKYKHIWSQTIRPDSQQLFGCHQVTLCYEGKDDIMMLSPIPSPDTNPPIPAPQHALSSQ